MAKDIFRTVRELLQSSKCVLMGNAVNNEGELYDDSVENLTAILAVRDMLESAEVMQEFADDVWIRVSREGWEALV
jgi:hypothetical protein